MRYKLCRLQCSSFSSQGFTLTELLVVIIIISVLSAIALPSFLSQAARAKQSEAKTYIGTVLRSQQAYYLEKDQFAGTLGSLGVGIPSQTESYTYSIGAASSTTTQFNAITLNPTLLKSYASAVLSRDDDLASVSCQTKVPSSSTPDIDLNIHNPNNPRCRNNAEPLN